MGERGAAVGVVGGDDLALLGHAQAAADRARGLSLDGAAGGGAAATDRAAAAVEIGDLDVELAADAGERELRLEQRPIGGEEAAVLVRVGVAEHDLLGATE